MDYIFRTIDLDKHYATCWQFRKDSYQLSFGDHHGFEADMASYKERMTKRISYLPQGNCHLWFGDKIIGQTEMKCVEDNNVGYVSLVYLEPGSRYQGIGRLLQRLAVDVFSALGNHSIQLSVSSTNKPAHVFYQKHGWRCLGPRPDKESALLMSYSL